MNFTSDNTQLWHILIQGGLLAVVLLLGNLLRRKIRLLRASLLPAAVIGGFIALACRLAGWLPFDKTFLDAVTYHMTAIGFIALGLRMPSRVDRASSRASLRDGINSGVFIVSNYLMQGALGIIITLFLSATLMPDIFKASGLILPLGYGQGPGQAYNVGNTYEQNWGFAGGGSFGLAIATMGTLWACIGGIIYLNIHARKRRVELADSEQLAADKAKENFVDADEIPLSESVDKFTVQIALVLLVYGATYLLARALSGLMQPFPGLAKSIVPLIWGFNFLIGSSLALVLRNLFGRFRKAGWMTRKYTNGYLLNRISGSAFDIMIFASICAIEIDDLRGLWLPFAIMTTLGGLMTMIYIRWMARRLYPAYPLEGLLAMYGMMTGTVSTGILLLREIDPSFRTPAANNLVVGSSTAILLGFPMLLMIGLAPQSDLLLWVTLGACLIYGAALNFFMLRRARRITP